MKIILAPNGFKGNLHAYQVANAIELGLKDTIPDAEIVNLPIADGGAGTVDLFIKTAGGSTHTLEVQNANSQAIAAKYGILTDGKTAIIELAAASGIAAIDLEDRHPMRASTFGTGQLILDALDKGCTKIILGVGGSASTDAGTGILQALGIRFLNDSEFSIPPGGGGLAFLHGIDVSGLDPRVASTQFIIACDVVNPLLGPDGSAIVFGPQKGATPDQVNLLEENLTHLNGIVKEKLDIDMGSIPFGGAAGGTSAGLNAFLGAKLISGIDFLLHQIGFDEKLFGCDYLITAEGKLDLQSLEGKGPYGVAKRAAVRGIPAFCVTGQIPLLDDAKQMDVFQAIFPITTAPMDLAEAKERAEELLEFTGRQIGQILSLLNKK